MKFEVPPELAGQRLDKSLAQLMPEYSRSRLQRWLRDGLITVDGQVLRPRDKLRGGEAIVACPEPDIDDGVTAQPIDLEIVHAGDSFLVINKPAGLVVHPGAGHPDGTLQNGLLHHDARLERVPRAGIVHRLDKDTSGLLVVARTLAAHKYLVAELAARRVTREYEALVCGVLTAGGSVDAPIGRHPGNRKRMAVRDGGRQACTHYRVIRRLRAHTHARLELESGRTHQIRVHMQHIGYPLLGDPVYGRRLAIPSASSAALVTALRGCKRQALHARRLAFVHPQTGETVEWSAPRPQDMQDALDALTTDAEQAGVPR